VVGFTPWNEEKHEEGGKEMPKRAPLVVLSEEEQTALVQLTKRHKIVFYYTPKHASWMNQKEADFLVCYEGQSGILEINGDTYHLNSAKDHNRGRLFKLHGIKVFEPYEASRCIKEPDKVVQEFLELIKKNG